MRTQVPEPGRGKQRITSSMSSGIPIRMPGKPRLPWPLKPRKKQSPARLKRMHIHPKPNPRHILHSSKPYREPGVSTPVSYLEQETGPPGEISEKSAQVAPPPHAFDLR